MSELRMKLKRDETYQRYRSILSTVRAALDLEKQLKEAAYLHKRRRSRKLFETRVSPAKLMDAILEDLSNRSRLVEIKVLMLNQQELLASAISLGKKHVRATYAEILRDYGSTKEAQLLVVEKVFSSGAEVLAEINCAVTALETYIKDLDQASYGLNATKDVLRMLLDRKEAVSI